MGLMRWMRGGDDNSATAAAVSAGLAEIDGLFRPSRHKQTEHVEEAKRKRVDVANGAGIDLERGVAMVRSADAGPATDDGDGVAAPALAVPRPRTVFVPRKQTWWGRIARARRRRARARAATRSSSAA